MRLIDADKLLEHVYADKPDSYELIADMVKNTPTATSAIEMEKVCEELRAHIEYLSRQNNSMKGEIKALVFVVRCNSMSGNEVQYEAD